MVEVELRPGGAVAAVLTSEIITRENVVARITNVAARQTIEKRENNDTRYPNFAARTHHGLFIGLRRRCEPALEIKSLVLVIDHIRGAREHKRKGSLGRRDVNRQERSIENQHSNSA